MTSSLRYPDFKVKLKKLSNKVMIFDEIRKDWFVCTPEEWVRQHVINYLINSKRYPSSLIAVEKSVILNDLAKRFDIVVYSNDLKPYLLVECKAMYVELTAAVAEQAMRYNLVLKAPYFMITNGIEEFVFNKNQISSIPNYD
jgi:hypothetical protein